MGREGMVGRILRLSCSHGALGAHSGSILAKGRAFAVAAGKGLSLTVTFPSPEPWLPCEQNSAAHCGVAG